MARKKPSFAPSREQRIWCRLRAHYAAVYKRDIPRRRGNTLVLHPAGHLWRLEVKLLFGGYSGRLKPPYESPHPALGWPLVDFSGRNADDGFSETSTTWTYADPEGWFTLTEYKLAEAWMESGYSEYVAKVREWRAKRRARTK